MPGHNQRSNQVHQKSENQIVIYRVVAKGNGHSFHSFQSRKQLIPLLRLHTATALLWPSHMHYIYRHQTHTHTHFPSMSMGFPKTAMSRPKLSPANSAHIHTYGSVCKCVYIAWGCVCNQATVNKVKLHSIYYTLNAMKIKGK